MPKWVFVFPPSADPTTPPLCLGRISASILSHFGDKIHFSLLDENQRFSRYAIDLVLSGAMEDWVKEALKRELPREFKEHLKNLSPILPSLKEELLKALGILKVKDLFLDIASYSLAYKAISRAFEVFSLPYYPALVGFAGARLAVDIGKSKEIESAILNPVLNPYLNYFRGRIDELGHADLLGISLIYSSQILPALTLARLAKLHNNNIVVLFGGPCASQLRETLNQKFGHLVDQTIPGDAEAFFDYLSCSGINLDLRENVVNAAKDYVGLPPIKWFKAPGPFLDYSWANLEHYLLPEPVLCLDVTRGCYYQKCVFCAYGHPEARYRKMAVPDVIRLVEGLKEKHKAERFLFSVDVVDPQFLKKLSQEFIKTRTSITYSLDARLEEKFTDQRFVEQVYESGCRAISFGMESASQATLETMAKGTNSSHFSTILKTLNHAQIHVQVHLIHGFPGESRRQLEETLMFLRKHASEIVTAGVSPFTLLKGSKMEKKTSDYGITSVVSVGDMALDYEFKAPVTPGYPGYQRFEKELFSLFPAIARLTGSTTDFLIYASHYTPAKMKELLSFL